MGAPTPVRSGLVAGGALLFQVDRRLTDAEVATLALHVCGETYAFSEASYSDAVGDTPGYSWSAGHDWSQASTRTLQLSKKNTPATGAPEISGTNRVGRTPGRDHRRRVRRRRADPGGGLRRLRAAKVRRVPGGWDRGRPMPVGSSPSPAADGEIPVRSGRGMPDGDRVGPMRRSISA